MRRNLYRTIALCLLATPLFDACGGDDAPAPVRVNSTRQTTAAPTFEVELKLEGSYPNGAVHIVRVERPDGSRVFERTLSGQLITSEALAPGDYRVLSFQRECRSRESGSCGPETAPADLGEPADICGSYFTVAADKKTVARVALIAQDSCVITLS